MKFDQGLLHMFITKDVICDVCREKMSVVGHSFKLETLSYESVLMLKSIVLHAFETSVLKHFLFVNLYKIHESIVPA